MGLLVLRHRYVLASESRLLRLGEMVLHWQRDTSWIVRHGPPLAVAAADAAECDETSDDCQQPQSTADGYADDGC